MIKNGNVSKLCSSFPELEEDEDLGDVISNDLPVRALATLPLDWARALNGIAAEFCWNEFCLSATLILA